MYSDIPDFTGPFKDILPGYIAYKRSIGYKFHGSILYRLKEIDRFFSEHGIEEVEISEEMFELWTARHGQERRSNQWRRTSALNCFARYLVEQGYENIYTCEYPKGAWARTFNPYIFTHEEIDALFSAAGAIRKSREYDRDSAALTVLLSLYYGCGLRKSEALDVKMGDVDIDTGTIRILDGKNGTSRIIVASKSVTRAIEAYAGLLCVGFADEEFMFQDAGGAQFKGSRLYSLWYELLECAGIPRRTDARGPRIHDLRHSFCVHALEQMDERGFDLYASAPLLCAYLGHKTISETEYYLRLVEENFRCITEKSEQYAPGLFPKVGGSDGE
jgi:integrase